MQDELLNEFINESREHLATIEADLLAIEEAGAQLDENLVNKVFRAAHSLKGGAGFLGLEKVKDLAHKAETVLDMLRSRKIVPDAEVTNILLAAFDRLRGMINDPAGSDSVDTSDLLVALTDLASSYLDPEHKASLTRKDALQSPGLDQPVLVPQVDVDRARRSGQCIYCVDYDLIHDVEKKGLNLLQVFRELAETGEILDCIMNLEAVGTLETAVSNQLPMRLVLATSLAPHLVPELLGVAENKVRLLFDPYNEPAKAPESVAVPAPTAPAPMPAPRLAEPTPTAPPARQAPDFAPESSRPTVPNPGSASPAANKDKDLLASLKEPTRRTDAPSGWAAESQTSATAADETLRVNVGLLETLMNLAGELVLSRNQLRSAVAHNDTQALQVADQRLNQVTSDLQDAIMRTRLQPVGNVFGKFPRVVRDLANALHKEISLDIRGKDVALDRSLIEGLSDPLTHLVRNAVDHGIEPPGDRMRAGKKACGIIRIEARHEAGQVVVEIADDGRGIQPQKVADSAVAKGLISEERVREMSDQEKIGLIFLPGLSTADKVTDVSGRGVGMDVVKTNLDRLGGKADIESKPGKGTTIRIKLPLTLAIIPSLIVSVGSVRYAIPQVNVEELLCIRPDDTTKRIEVVGNTEVLLLRDRIMPLLRLASFLGAESASTNASADAETLAIAVVTTGSLRYGIVVGSFHDTEEIVVKPLGRNLKGLREYAGATILGDGTVVLILDVGGLAAKAELGKAADGAEPELDEEAERARLESVHPMLLFHNAPNEVCATPLDTVLRIERITPDQVEELGNRRTIKYRGGSLPLVTLADAARVQSLGDTQDLAVIISSVRGHEVGLLGAMPVDVVEIRDTIDQTTHRQPGIAGSAIIRDRTTLIADVFELVDAVYPEWGAKSAPAEPARRVRSALVPVIEDAPGDGTRAERPAPPAVADEAQSVLLAEDSDFFRAQIRRYLEQDGFRVYEAPDGEAAWELLMAQGERITAVVTDIEMPRLTGLGLARRIRGDERFSWLPIIALSSLAGDDDIAAGKAAGIDDYQVKLDRDRLITGLRTVAHAA